MNLPTSKLRKPACCLVLLLVTSFAQGQGIDAYPLTAWIQIPSNRNAFKVTIHASTPNENATMSLSGQTQRRLVNISIIEKINFMYPPAILESLQGIDDQNFSQTDLILKAYAEAMIPFLSVPANNIARILDSYEHSLHQRNDITLLRDLYTKLARVEDPSYPLNAKAWLAYLDTREGDMEQANQLFTDPDIQPDDAELYFLQQMALCRIRMSENKYRSAIDHSSRVVATGTIEDALYPEAVYISARCYDGLAEREQARLEEEREEAVQKEQILERVRVALELEAAADEAGAPPPCEQEILDAIDLQEVEARIPPVPPLKENAFAHIAQQLYSFTEQVFPSTTWGEASGREVWPETRARTSKDLTNFTPTDIPK